MKVFYLGALWGNTTRYSL